MKLELKNLYQKLVTEYRVEGKIYEKVTYQSLYYHLKMTAEVLGVHSNNKELTNLQSTVCHQKIQDQKEQMEEIIHFVDDEINELESFKDAISNLKGYITLRN
jgi:hypothetical protein